MHRLNSQALNYIRAMSACREGVSMRQHFFENKFYADTLSIITICFFVFFMHVLSHICNVIKIHIFVESRFTICE